MFRKIIWATDGSEAADAALPFAQELAAGPDGYLLAVHAEQFFRGRAGAYPVLADEDELVAKIRGQVEQLRADGIAADLKVDRKAAPHAAHMIAQVASDIDADVIVVGTRGHSPIGGLVVGSVTQQLLHLAGCPVLVVPTAAHTAAHDHAREHDHAVLQ
jgi:nucleotide-binding universal stress UspA family protein